MSQKTEYAVQYDQHRPGRSPAYERRVATGWFTNDGNRIRGIVRHEGSPNDVSPARLLPEPAKKAGYIVKLEIDDTGAGHTSWLFDVRVADVDQDSIRMPPADFWDKVSMSTNADGNHTFQGRVVDSIQINFKPKARDPRRFTSMNEGGRL